MAGEWEEQRTVNVLEDENTAESLEGEFGKYWKVDCERKV